jgi:hypothetical protein
MAADLVGVGRHGDHAVAPFAPRVEALQQQRVGTDEDGSER